MSQNDEPAAPKGHFLGDSVAFPIGAYMSPTALQSLAVVCEVTQARSYSVRRIPRPSLCLWELRACLAYASSLAPSLGGVSSL